MKLQALTLVGTAALALPGLLFPAHGIEGKTAVQPSAMWVKWFDEVADCMGLEGDATGADWYVADRLRVPVITGMHWSGDIYIKRTRAYEPRTVKHEAIHYLLWVNGYDTDGAHAGRWYDRCVRDTEDTDLIDGYGLLRR